MKWGTFAFGTMLFLLAGCAGRQQVNTLAGRTSSILNDYRQEMSAFAQRQTTLRQDNQRRLRNFAQMREQQEALVSRTLLGWQLANETDAIVLFNLTTRADAESIRANSAALRLVQPAQASVAAVRFDAAQVETVVRRLKALEQPQSFWDQLAFGVAYSQALRNAYRNSIDDAGEESAESIAAAAATPPPGSTHIPPPPDSNNR